MQGVALAAALGLGGCAGYETAGYAWPSYPSEYGLGYGEWYGGWPDYVGPYGGGAFGRFGEFHHFDHGFNHHRFAFEHQGGPSSHAQPGHPEFGHPAFGHRGPGHEFGGFHRDDRVVAGDAHDARRSPPS